LTDAVLVLLVQALGPGTAGAAEQDPGAAFPGGETADAPGSLVAVQANGTVAEGIKPPAVVSRWTTVDEGADPDEAKPPAAAPAVGVTVLRA
jgi:hypothetical protein